MPDKPTLTEAEWHFDRWWRVVTDTEGRVWCETSDEAEARAAMLTCPGPCRLERHQYQAPPQRWVPA